MEQTAQRVRRRGTGSAIARRVPQRAASQVCTSARCAGQYAAARAGASREAAGLAWVEKRSLGSSSKTRVSGGANLCRGRAGKRAWTRQNPRLHAATACPPQRRKQHAAVRGRVAQALCPESQGRQLASGWAAGGRWQVGCGAATSSPARGQLLEHPTSTTKDRSSGLLRSQPRDSRRGSKQSVAAGAHHRRNARRHEAQQLCEAWRLSLRHAHSWQRGLDSPRISCMSTAAHCVASAGQRQSHAGVRPRDGSDLHRPGTRWWPHGSGPQQGMQYTAQRQPLTASNTARFSPRRRSCNTSRTADRMAASSAACWHGGHGKTGRSSGQRSNPVHKQFQGGCVHVFVCGGHDEVGSVDVRGQGSGGGGGACSCGRGGRQQRKGQQSTYPGGGRQAGRPKWKAGRPAGRPA